MPKTIFNLDEADIAKALNFWFEHDFAEPKNLRAVSLRHQSGDGDPREPLDKFWASIEA